LAGAGLRHDLASPFDRRVELVDQRGQLARRVDPHVAQCTQASGIVGPALAMRSAGSQESGGVTSAVIVNCPAESAAASERLVMRDPAWSPIPDVSCHASSFPIV
jgi:hypothetical protein